MKAKLTGMINRYSGTFRYALVLNLLILCVVHIFFRPLNVTDDNLYIGMACNRAYGVADPRTMFINVVIGAVLEGLYFLTTSVPWYDVFSEIIIFLSLSALALVFTKIFGNRLGTLLFVIIAIFIAPQAYIRVQFTKTSGVASAAGLAVLVHACAFEGKKREYVLGFIVSLLGFCYRPMQFMAEAVLILPVIVLYFISGNRKKFLICASSLLFLMMALFGVDYASYEVDPGWKSYRDMSPVRADLYDYGFPSYEDNIDRLEELGIKESAWKLMRSYNYADPEVFTPDVFREIKAMKGEQRRLSGTVIKEFVAQVPYELFSEPEFCLALIFFIFFLAYAGRRPLAYVSAFGCVLMFSALYLLFFLRGRYLMERVDMGLFLAMAVTFAFSAAWSGKGQRQIPVPDLKVAVLAAGAVLVLSQVYLRDSWRVSTKERGGISRGQTEKIMEMSGDKEHLYLCKMRYPDMENAFEPFDTMPAGMLSNIYFLGGWQVFEPVTLAPLKNFGVTNPYRDAISDDRILFVDDDIELTLDYIHDYYDPGAEAVPQGLIGNEYQVYSIKGSSGTGG